MQMRYATTNDDLEDVVVARMYQPRYAGVECACNPEELRGRIVITWKKLRTYRAEGNASLVSCLPRVSSEYPLEAAHKFLSCTTRPWNPIFRPACLHGAGTEKRQKGKQSSRDTSVWRLPDSEHNWARATEQTRPNPRSRRAPNQVERKKTEGLLPGIDSGRQPGPHDPFHEPFRSHRRTPACSLVMDSITSQSVPAFQ